ncbi:hypothetical protein P154DRAFT_608330 [Amniculicola lignicola CBS 123094]|uniref:Uncharacterized protein n=1 Tax=Amniculicola lignicola CBS 123094 TaxID=1392246 RepID=A0A6A5W5K1_9PLEO|nr:hypothetical protein P154DRAFT_608330 [Amniculicola lignicola CBS 123094]
MSFHGIVSKRIIGSLSRNGRQVTLSAATETDAWRRSDEMADKVGEILKTTVEKKPEQLPADTQQVILRESVHTSDADKRDHLTVVCVNDKGEGKTLHLTV